MGWAEASEGMRVESVGSMRQWSADGRRGSMCCCNLRATMSCGQCIACLSSREHEGLSSSPSALGLLSPPAALSTAEAVQHTPSCTGRFSTWQTKGVQSTLSWYAPHCTVVYLGTEQLVADVVCRALPSLSRRPNILLLATARSQPASLCQSVSQRRPRRSVGARAGGALSRSWGVALD